MLVRDCMSKKIITVNSDNNIKTAIDLLREHNINMLPVVENDKLVGVLSDVDIKKNSASDIKSLEIYDLVNIISNLKVKDIMTKDPVSVPWNNTIDEVANSFLNNKISGAPVINDQGKIIGIITRNDLFEILISLTSVSQAEIQMQIIIEDKTGSLKDITDLIRKYGGRVSSLLSDFDQVEKGFRRANIHIYDIDQDNIEAMKKDISDKGKITYFISHLQNIREYN